MNYQFKRIEYGGAAYAEMLNLRNVVLRDPINFPRLKAEDLTYERDVMLLGGYDEKGVLKACCVVLPEGPGVYRLRQMAVDNSLHGQGLGRQLLEFAEQNVLKVGGKELMMNARHYAVGFYEKCGYKIEGESFEEVGMEHWRMRRLMIND